MNIGNLVAHLRLDSNVLRADLARAGASMKAFGARTDRMLNNMQSSIMSVQGAFAALGIGVAVRSVVNDFSVLDKGLIGIRKTTNITGPALEQLGKDIQKIGRELPVPTAELLEIAQAAGQLGVQGADNILKFTNTVAMLGTASDLAGADAAMTLARLLAVTGESADQVDVLGSVIVELGNNMAATESEIAEVGTAVAQSTAAFQVSSAEAVAMGAAMRSMGIQSEIAGTATGRTLRMIEDAIVSGGDKMENLVEIMGMGADEIAQAFEERPMDVFRQFLRGLNDIVVSGGSAAKTLEVFGLQDQRLLRVLPTLATNINQVDLAFNLASEEVSKNTALTKEAMAASESFAGQMQIMGNRIDEVGAKLGKTLAPALLTATETLINFTHHGYQALQMLGEMIAGRVGFFDKEMWNADAADAYLNDEVARAKKLLEELENNNIDAMRDGIFDFRAISVEDIEAQKKQLRDFIRMNEEAARAAKINESITSSADAVDYRPGMPDLSKTGGGDGSPPPRPDPFGGRDFVFDDAESEAAKQKSLLDQRMNMLRQWEDAVNRSTMNEVDYTRWAADQELEIFKESEAWLNASQTERDSIVAAHAKYREQVVLDTEENVAEERKRLLEDFNDDYIRTVVGQTQAEIMAINERAEELRKAAQGNAEELIKIAEWRESEITRIMEEHEEDRLENSKLAVDGMKRALQSYVEDVEDHGAIMEAATTKALKGMKDALVEFATTGKLEFSDLVDSVIADMTRMAAQQVTGQLAGGFLGGMGGGGRRGGGGGFLGGIMNLFGFVQGGSFPVNASTSMGTVPGVDNRLIAFRARDGEEVSVTPRGGQKSGQVTMYINTPDANSFRRSQNQIMTKASQALSRAQGRNG